MQQCHFNLFKRNPLNAYCPNFVSDEVHGISEQEYIFPKITLFFQESQFLLQNGKHIEDILIP